LQNCQRLAALDGRLPAFLSGASQPRDAAQALALAELCQQYKHRYVAAVRFCEAAFTAQPALAEELAPAYRYNAACAAVLASCGQGQDASSQSDRAKERLRSKALQWLRADLACWAVLAGKTAAQARQEVHRNLRKWLSDPKLAGVRHPEALAKLPDAERQDWQKLWAEVARRFDETRGNSR
jgi:hypothetical protein